MIELLHSKWVRAYHVATMLKYSEGEMKHIKCKSKALKTLQRFELWENWNVTVSTEIKRCFWTVWIMLSKIFCWICWFLFLHFDCTKLEIFSQRMNAIKALAIAKFTLPLISVRFFSFGALTSFFKCAFRPRMEYWDTIWIWDCAAIFN